MAADRVERRLSAILAADVVGYSRLMRLDEAGTLNALNVHRSELIDAKIAEHRGRIVKLTGDGMLVEFPSVVNAVACSADIQRGMFGRNESVPDDRRIEFRIGINLGDVIVEGDDIFGDGVNVAARLEGIARPGGIAISASVRDQVGDRLALTFEDMGEQTLKNIAQPVRVFEVRWDEGSRTAASSARLAGSRTLPDKPSLAVLPFQNMSGDAEQEYFADGVVEDIITALSRFRSFAVIARNSSFVYKGRAVDVRQAAKELGVRYVLEGSVRRAGNRLRITAQLIEAAAGAHLWADRFDGTVEDVFDVQDRITENVVGVIEPEIRKAEIDRARRKPPESLDAYDLYLRAVPLVYGMDADGFPAAIELLSRAAVLDPDFALAPAYAAWTYEKRATLSLPPLGPNDRESCLSLARRALALGGDDPLVRVIGGFVLFTVGGDTTVLKALDQAMEANPNNVVILVLVGAAKLWLHDFDGAYDCYIRAYRLSPGATDTYQSLQGLGSIEVLRGNYEAGIEWLLKSLATFNDWPLTYRPLAAAYAHLGRMEEAAAAIKRLREIAPYSTIEQLIEGSGLHKDTVTPLYIPALRKAGLPER
jgi:adenylate cyclase